MEYFCELILFPSSIVSLIDRKMKEWASQAVASAAIKPQKETLCGLTLLRVVT